MKLKEKTLEEFSVDEKTQVKGHIYQIPVERLDLFLYPLIGVAANSIIAEGLNPEDALENLKSHYLYIDNYEKLSPPERKSMVMHGHTATYPFRIGQEEIKQLPDCALRHYSQWYICGRPQYVLDDNKKGDNGGEFGECIIENSDLSEIIAHLCPLNNISIRKP